MSPNNHLSILFSFCSFKTDLVIKIQATRAHLLEKLAPVDPLKNIMNLFNKSDWVFKYDMDRGLLMLAIDFILALGDLKADQNSTVQFIIESDSDMPCFSHVRRASASVLKIIQAVFPTLQSKGLKYSLEITDLDHYRQSRTIFYWCFRDITTPFAELEMNWCGQYDHDQRTGKYVFKHQFTFSANSVWLVERAEDIEILEQIRPAALLLPFVMGVHKRLGATSPIRFLHLDVLKLIGIFVNKTL